MDKSRRIILEQTKDFPQLVFDYIKGRVSAQDVVSQSMVDKIIENSNRVKSIFNFKMDGNELVEFFNLDEYDYWWISRLLDGGTMEYESYDDIDDRMTENDFFLGDFFDRSSEEYYMILKLYRKFNENFNANRDTRPINETLLKSYPREVNQILDVIYEYRNEGFTEKMGELISNQLSEVLGPYGVNIETDEKYSNYFHVSIPAGNLYYLMKIYPNIEEGQSDSVSIYSAMNGLTRGKKIGGWEEERWNIDVNEFQKNPRYVSETNQMITDLLEKVDEEVSPQRTEILTKILKQFGTGKPINVPQKNIRFAISHYDAGSNKLILFVNKVTDGRYSDLPIRRWGGDGLKISPQNFYNWYHNYELTLESKNILLSLRKILSHDSQ
jgi:hypothetical protein